MFLQAASIPNGTTVQADVCIVGAGAAGITLARELGAAGRKVILLESGPFDYDAATEDLNAGLSAGRPYLDLATSRQRYFGGTTNHWGGWCLPQEPIDFERGWPITRADLDPFYRRAQDIVQLGPYDYRVASWGIRPPDVPAPFAGPHFVPKMMQNSPPTRFRENFGPELRRSDRVAVYLGATLTRIATTENASTIDHIQAATLAGTSVTVRAGAYVLACGGVENARILLLSAAPGQAALGNAHDRVGRTFMVHLQCPGGTVAVADPYTDFGFYTNVTSNGRDYGPFRRRFVTFCGLSEATMRDRALPNVKVMWHFGYGAGMKTINAVRGATSWSGTGHRLEDIGSVMSDLGGTGRYLFRRLFAYPSLPIETLRINYTFEPTPYPDSRIRLGDTLDALGQRRVVVDWQVDPADRRHAAAITRLLGAEIGRAGLGRLQTTLDRDDTDWPPEMFGDQHHMGTTRMSSDPAQGVVDADCRVHGLTNLYIAGSSVFPRAGIANPTLTILALALRLAQHLRRPPA